MEEAEKAVVEELEEEGVTEILKARLSILHGNEVVTLIQRNSKRI